MFGLVSVVNDDRSKVFHESAWSRTHFFFILTRRDQKKSTWEHHQLANIFFFLLLSSGVLIFWTEAVHSFVCPARASICFPIKRARSIVEARM